MDIPEFLFKARNRVRNPGYYEVLTNVPVGDLPREADIVLLRRSFIGPLPFQGLWRYLTPWNVLEFKGPTVHGRVWDFDLLLEVGLGIHRRLNEEQKHQNQPLIERDQISFWYLANRLGRRFLSGLAGIVGPLEAQGPGVWRGEVCQRPVILVSGGHLPVEQDSLPLHILGQETLAGQRQVVGLLADRPVLWQEYSAWLATLHPELWEEIKAMGKTRGRKFGFHLGPVIEEVGLKNVIEEVGLNRVIEQVGLKRVFEQVGLDRVLGEVGWDRFIRELSRSTLRSQMTAAQRRELKRLLEE
jgi:hypothetical protein